MSVPQTRINQCANFQLKWSKVRWTAAQYVGTGWGVFLQFIRCSLQRRDFVSCCYENVYSSEERQKQTIRQKEHIYK